MASSEFSKLSTYFSFWSLQGPESSQSQEISPPALLERAGAAPQVGGRVDSTSCSAKAAQDGPGLPAGADLPSDSWIRHHRQYLQVPGSCKYN